MADKADYVMRLLFDGLSPSEIDDELKLAPGTAHDEVCHQWATDKEARGRGWRWGYLTARQRPYAVSTSKVRGMIDSSSMSTDEVAEGMAIAPRTLRDLLSGKAVLKVPHLLALCDTLGIRDPRSLCVRR